MSFSILFLLNCTSKLYLLIFKDFDKTFFFLYLCVFYVRDKSVFLFHYIFLFHDMGSKLDRHYYYGAKHRKKGLWDCRLFKYCNREKELSVIKELVFIRIIYMRVMFM